MIYDRMREIRGKSPKISGEMINTAINQTFAARSSRHGPCCW